MKMYDNLWNFINFDDNLEQLYNISKFFEISWFMTVCEPWLSHLELALVTCDIKSP